MRESWRGRRYDWQLKALQRREKVRLYQTEFCRKQIQLAEKRSGPFTEQLKIPDAKRPDISKNFTRGHRDKTKKKRKPS